MKQNLLIWVLLLCSGGAWAQTTIRSQNFESGEPVNYTSNTFDLRGETVTNAVNQYFTITNTNPPQNPFDATNYSFGASADPIAIKNSDASANYTGRFWIAEGVRGTNNTISYARDPGYVALNAFDASGYTNIKVTVAFVDPRGPGSKTVSGAGATPSAGSFNADDKIEIQYSTDGGANFITIGRFSGNNNNGSTGYMELDYNLNSDVNDEVQPTLNYKMTDYTFGTGGNGSNTGIPGSPSSLIVRVVVDQRGTSQEIGFDNIRVTGTPSTTQPPILIDGTTSTVNYTEGGDAVQISSTIAPGNPAGPNLDGATVSISSGLRPAEDVLAFTPVAGITGTYNNATGVLTFSGTAPIASYQQVLRSVTYRNSNGTTAKGGNRAVQYVVSSGASTSSGVVRNVFVTAILGGPAALPYTEDFTDDGEGVRYGSNALVGTSGIGFTRTNVTPYDAFGVTFSNISNGYYWYGVNTTSLQLTNRIGRLETQQVDARNFNNLHFQIRLGAESGSGAAWQASDMFKMYYRTGGSSGTWKLFGSFRGSTTDINGTGEMRQDRTEDLANLPSVPAGTATLTPVLTNFDFALPSDASGQLVDFKVELTADDTRAEFAFDLIQVSGTPVAPPTVTTNVANSITSTSAVLGGNVTADGGGTVTERGVVYVAGTGTPTTSNSKALLSTTVTIGTVFTGTVPGLSPATQYTVRAYGINSAGTGYGPNYTFTTAAALATTGSQTNISCFGAGNGSATVNVTGGVTPYTYSWSPSGGNAATATGLAPNTYTVTVTDASGATITRDFTITQPNAPLSGTTVVTNVACFGGANGAINLTPAGGSGGYTFLWNNGTTTTEDRTGLPAGTYSVTITDANNCQAAVNNIAVSQPSAAVSGTTVVTNIACFGGNTGAINLTPAGGTGSYSFNWGGGITTEDRTALAAGTYSVTITDANGCTGTVSNISVVQPSAPVSGTTVVTNVACFGGSNGAINLTPTGGTSGGYTFQWTNGPTTEDRTGLVTGSYSVVITDINGCTGTISNINVSQPSAPVSGTTVVTNTHCFGGNTGSINLTPTGGTGPYTYRWNDGTTTEDRTFLAAGTYSVTITDKNGCTATINTINVSQPERISGTTVVTNVACFGGNTGAINLTPTGGTPGGYSFSWYNSGGITSEDRTNLTAGNYSVIITDINGCTGSLSNISVSQPSAAVSGTTVVTNVACFGGNTGAINLTPAGGTAPYTFLWNNGTTTTEDRTSLTAGTYSVTITDNNGCQATVSNISVSQPSAAVSGTTVVTNVACFGGSNGTINLTPAGGTAPYTFFWNNGTTTEDRTGLAAGTYSVQITDNNGCTSTVSNISVNQPSAVNASIGYTGSPYFTGTGTAAVTFSGTSGGAYSSTTGLVVNASTGAIDLAASTPGSYTVTYTIANATCGDFTTTTQVTLVSPFSATITYAGSPYCDTTGMAMVTLTGTQGGTFTSTAGLVIDASTGAINLATSTPGTYTVRYGTTPSDFTTTQVAVRPTTFINPEPNQVVCAGTAMPAINFTGVPGTGYSWTVQNPAIGLPASGTGSLPAFTATNSGSTQLQSYITVQATGGTGCPAKRAMTFRISVNPAPVLSAVADQTLCTGSLSAPVLFSSSLSGTTTSWMNNNTGIGLIAAGTGNIGSFNVTNNSGAVQTATITATPSVGACVGTPISFTIAVSPSAGTISYPQASYCQYAWTYVRRTGAAGGSYSAAPAGLALNSTDGSINLAASLPGIYTVTYTVGAGAGCSNTASTTITIQPQSIVSAVPNPVFCQGVTTAPIAFTGTAASYSWTNDNTSIGLTASGTGNLPSFTTVNAGPTTQYANIRVTPQGNGSSVCPGKTIGFRIAVSYCPPVTQSVGTGSTDATARTSGMSAAFGVGPNPARTTAVLSYNGKEQSTFAVQLLNSYGSAIGKPGTFTGSTYTLDLAGVTPGTYLVQITDVKTGSSCVKQVVKL